MCHRIFQRYASFLIDIFFSPPPQRYENALVAFFLLYSLLAIIIYIFKKIDGVIHFIIEETEAQRHSVTCPRSQDL